MEKKEKQGIHGQLVGLRFGGFETTGPLPSPSGRAEGPNLMMSATGISLCGSKQITPPLRTFVKCSFSPSVRYRLVNSRGTGDGVS